MNILITILLTWLVFAVLNTTFKDKYWTDAIVNLPANLIYITLMGAYIILTFPFCWMWNFMKQVFKPLSPTEFERIWIDKSLNITYLFGSLYFVKDKKDVPKYKKYFLVYVLS